MLALVFSPQGHEPGAATCAKLTPPKARPRNVNNDWLPDEAADSHPRSPLIWVPQSGSRELGTQESPHCWER